MIQDSGERVEFATGAVRDIREGKGRCDLLPLEVIAKLFDDPYLNAIARYVDSGDTNYLYDALRCASEKIFPNLSTLAIEVSIHFEEGAKKYGERNWQKGIPAHCYIDSAIRHYLNTFVATTMNATIEQLAGIFYAASGLSIISQISMIFRNLTITIKIGGLRK